MKQTRCYICGRSSEDLNFIHDEVDHRFEKEIANIEMKKEKLVDNYRQNHACLIELLEGIPDDRLDFKPVTIETDMETFLHKIPNMEVIITECKKLPNFSGKSSLRSLLNQARSAEKLDSYKNITDRIGELRDMRKRYHDEDKDFVERKILLRDIYIGENTPVWGMQPEYPVHLCIICNKLIIQIARENPVFRE